MTANEAVVIIRSLIEEGGLHTPRDVKDIIDAQEVATIEYYQHRWYVTAIMVFNVAGDFFGVKGPVFLKSEGMTYSDTGYKCVAFVMEKFFTEAYRPKEKEDEMI